MMVFTCYFGDKNFKTCGGIYWNTGFFGEAEPFGLNSSKKKPGFNETTRGFKFLLQSYTWNQNSFNDTFFIPIGVSMKPFLSNFYGPNFDSINQWQAPPVVEVN